MYLTSEQEQLVERLAGEISKHKKELKLMKNERKRTKESENKTTQADMESTKATHISKQVNREFEVRFAHQTEDNSRIAVK